MLSMKTLTLAATVVFAAAPVAYGDITFLK
jgi:hypothetical protein